MRGPSPTFVGRDGTSRCTARATRRLVSPGCFLSSGPRERQRVDGRAGVSWRAIPGKQPDLAPQPRGQHQAARRFVLGRAILEEHRVPSQPMVPDYREGRPMGLVRPRLGDLEGHGPASDVGRPVEDSLRPVARDRHARLLADVAQRPSSARADIRFLVLQGQAGRFVTIPATPTRHVESRC